MLDAHGMEHLINFQFHFDYIEALFYNRKITRYQVYVTKKETQKQGFTKSKKRRCTTIIPHVNRNKPNNLNTPKSDNIIVTSNLIHSNIQNYSLFNTLVNLKIFMYIE